MKLRAVFSKKRERNSCAADILSEDALVEAAVHGDKDAYRRLVERYQQRVFSIAFSVLRNREDAEDVVQEGFVKAYLALADFHGEASFYTWLYRIVFHLAIDLKRKRTRQGAVTEYEDSVVSEPFIGSAGSVSGPHEQLYRKEQAQAICSVIQELSDDHRAVFLLREVDGFPYEEIAKCVGISKGTVMSRLHYARKKLQQALKQFVSPDVSLHESAFKVSDGATQSDGKPPESRQVIPAHEATITGQQ